MESNHWRFSCGAPAHLCGRALMQLRGWGNVRRQLQEVRGRGGIACAVAALFGAIPIHAHAQPCNPAWSDEIPGLVAGSITTLAQLDLGAGPRLFAGGPQMHTGLGAAVAAREGGAWRPVGQGIDLPNMSATVVALLAFDDGTGHALFAVLGGSGSGQRGGIFRYDSISDQWEQVAIVQGQAMSGAVFDDGAGPAIYIGGVLESVDGANITALARWRGQGHPWEPAAMFNAGPTSFPVHVSAMHVREEAGGPVLYIGGGFASVDGVSAANVARFSGGVWLPLGSGPGISSAPPAVMAMTSAPGAAPGEAELYLAGRVPGAQTTANEILKWDGEAWSSLGGPLVGINPRMLHVHEEAGAHTLYLGGDNWTGGGGSASPTLRRWSGSDWIAIGGRTEPVLSLADTPGGDGLIVGGALGPASQIGVPPPLMRWDGTWTAERIGLWGAWNPPTTITMIRALETPAHAGLYIGGEFFGIDGVRSYSALRWDSSAWHPFGDNRGLRDLIEFDDGGGPRLYGATNACIVTSGSLCSNVGWWNGASWEPLPSPQAGRATRLAVFDDGGGPTLLAAFGDLHTTDAIRIGRWDGVEWQIIGESAEHDIHALATFDDGTGEALYIAGDFSGISSAAASMIARWDGDSWSEVGGGVGPIGDGRGIDGMRIFDDGTGRALYISGNFLTAGGASAPGVARWDGAWSPVGHGIALPRQSSLPALAIFDDGATRTLYAGGMMSPPVQSLLFRLDGDIWTQLSAGERGSVLALEPQTAGEPSLWMGGTFINFGPGRSAYLARLLGCEGACYPNCDRSTIEPTLNIDDFTCFINAFAAASGLPHAQQLGHYANCDHSTIAPVLNIDDFTCFINAFAAGCR